ncbi:hypothetical protein CC2G_014869 [Coprinopsis cinerea AmutBmut pab1-1]|nr:hypothetical protein CC2G_014869 [Coprinopsis cinerea AmutBmut pab1-1]
MAPNDWDGSLEVGFERVFRALSDAYGDRERFERWLFKNVDMSCDTQECIRSPGACVLAPNDFSCGRCLVAGRHCPWLDAFDIAMVQKELKLGYGQAYVFYYQHFAKSRLYQNLRPPKEPVERSEHVPNVPTPVQWEARLSSTRTEIRLAQAELGRRQEKIEQLEDGEVTTPGD